MAEYWSPDQPYPNYFDESEYYVDVVPDSWKTGSVNPSTQHWYEWDPGFDGSDVVAIEGYVPTADTSVVSGKTYYYLVEEESEMSETAFAYSTYQTYLMYRTTTSGSYSKLIDIKDYPDMLPSVRLVLN